MSKAGELLKQHKKEELWHLCCGFLDLNTEQFMNIQKQLLLEQIELLKRSKLGRKVMRESMPDSIEEFRKQVPLTTYTDYCPELLEKNEEVLPAKPLRWIQTSGRSGEYPCKWVPVTQRFWDEAGLNFCALAILSFCQQKYDVSVKNRLKILHAVAQSPCLTGAAAYKIQEELDFRFMPSLQESENMTFDDRIAKGVKMILAEGMDGFFGLAGILVAVGEKIKQGSGKTKISKLVSDPRVLFRLLRGKLISKLARREMLPKDLWPLKAIVSMGTDSVIYKNKIKDLWGRAPLDIYANTESVILATQLWDYDSMVFFPNINFLEFIPEEEYFKGQNDFGYTPKTLLLDEVKPGENYEMVITNLHGGALVRYRLGDMVRITSLSNDKLDIKLPQMKFERRCDDLIDLGFVRLTERTIWQALENTGIPYSGWTARKEIDNRKSTLHLYIELQEPDRYGADEIATAVYEQIKRVDDGLYVYKDVESLEKLIDFKPIEVTILPRGAFSDYRIHRQQEGSSVGKLRPPHVNPPDTVLKQLGIQIEANGKGAKVPSKA